MAKQENSQEYTEQATAKATAKFVNPFGAGTSLEDFIKAKGETSVTDYLNGNTKEEGEPFTDADAKWIESEISAFKYNKDNKDRLLKQAAEEHKALHTKNEK